ncbi:glycosyl transferase [Actinoplanes ianthinogenes]|uniref:Glycosyl transferase n=1 Tax=Actinoplanes ianthinogenes TaxID=122358 RepID=A0ABM7LRT8_9ACTN|nr:glycosyltransferase family 4 protein [Actinoplanes ianthinogenes]BCJ41994.1 glycosyl transferase [Actinoplanes ianthinogenes]GGR38383.1 glycosyl transferase [Actinoplanes ianthinogenes]
MKVALLGPIAWRTPPLHYGPWELITSLLAEGLTERGVDVTLFATLDSLTKATLDGVVPTGYEESDEIDGRVWEAIHVSHALGRSGEFDLIHNHLDWLPLAFSAHCRAPMLTTVHGFSGQNILPAYRRAKSLFVSISDSDRSPDLDYLATVHHGVDLSGLPFHPDGGDDLILFGRIHPDKGTDLAVEIARRAGRRLIICGIVQDRRFFEEKVEPLIDGERVVYLGSVGPEERGTILGSGAALLHPIRFAEPFGLSVVESMACGTPVIAYRKGSMPEVIDDGVTGRLVDSVEAAAAAVDEIRTLDRGVCSARARERFSAARMVDDYLAIYRKILS